MRYFGSTGVKAGYHQYSGFIILSQEMSHGLCEVLMFGGYPQRIGRDDSIIVMCVPQSKR
jgi:hypothetical protein